MNNSADYKNYEDIINLPRHISKKHPPMSIYNRSAQFAPFAALTHHFTAVKETARLTDKQIELSEDEIIILNEKINFIKDYIIDNIEVSIEYFVPDKLKKGGEYKVIISIVKKIDDYEKFIILEDESKISFNSIINLDSNSFKGLFEEF